MRIGMNMKASPLQNWKISHLLKNTDLLILLFIGANLLITLPLAWILNIWFDEAYSLNTTGGGLIYAINQSITFERQAPAYFALLALWRQANNSIFFARLFSVCCIALTIYVSSLISRRYLEGLDPKWLSAAVAFNPMSIWAALEIRHYAFSLLLSALLLLLFHDAYLKQTDRRPTARLLYCFTAVLALYTYVLFVSLLFAQAIALLVFKRQRFFRNYLFDIVIVGVCLLPLVFLFLAKVTYLFPSISGQATNILPVSEESKIETWKRSISVIFGSMINALFPLNPSQGNEGRDIIRVLRLLLILTILLLGTLYLLKRRSIIPLQIKVVWLMTGLIALTLIPCIQMIGLWDFRHTITLFIPLMLSGIALLPFLKDIDRRLPYCLLGIVALFYITSLYTTYSPLAKVGDYRRVATFIMQHEHAQQPVWVFNSETAIALKPYYSGKNQVVSLPKQEDFYKFTVEDLVLRDEQSLKETLAKSDALAQKVWLVTNTGNLGRIPVYEHSFQILNQFVQDNYTVSIHQEFYGSNVKLLVKK